MNTFRTSFVTVIVVMFLASCALPGDGSVLRITPSLVSDEVIGFKSCMGEIHNARKNEVEVPPTVTFVKNLAAEMFLCENFRGAPVSFFGKKIYISKGRLLYAGYGYALAGREQVTDELLLEENFKRNYSDPRGKFKVKVDRRRVYIQAYDRTVPAYMIVAQTKYFGAPTIGALSVINFSHEGLDYTAFLWVHGLQLTEVKIVARFEKLLHFIILPSQLKVVQR